MHVVLLARGGGIDVPVWAFFVFVGLLGLYVVVDLLRSRRRRSKAEEPRR
jgi:hypothetical protein